MIQVDARKKIVVEVAKDLALPDNLTCEVEILLDFSGSMEPLYKTGKVQELLERLLPMALVFDDNGSAPVKFFSVGHFQGPDLTLKTLDNYTSTNIYPRYENRMSGTEYAPVLSTIKIEQDTVSKAKSLFGSLFSSPTPSVLPYAKLVLFITDGENSDHSQTVQQIIRLSKLPVFISAFGIGNASFSFLKKLDNLPKGPTGRDRDNVSFSEVNDLSRLSDRELYTRFMKEFPAWLKDVQTAGLCR